MRIVLAMFHVKPTSNQRLADVPRETKHRLELFQALLFEWSKTLNLVAPHDLAHLVDRHIDDSLQLLPFLPSQGEAADLGSGAGFPGLILAIASDLRFHLIESDFRKAAFLREAARLTAAPVTIHPQRVETVRIAPVDVVTARAVAPLSKLLCWAAPLLRPAGYCLFLKGRRIAAELTEASHHWHMQFQSRPSATGSGVILHVHDLAAVSGRRVPV